MSEKFRKNGDNASFVFDSPEVTADHVEANVLNREFDRANKVEKRIVKIVSEDEKDSVGTKELTPEELNITADFVEARAIHKKFIEAEKLEEQARLLEEKTKREVELLRQKSKEAKNTAESFGADERNDFLITASRQQKENVSDKDSVQILKQEVVRIRREAFEIAEKARFEHVAKEQKKETERNKRVDLAGNVRLERQKRPRERIDLLETNNADTVNQEDQDKIERGEWLSLKVDDAVDLVENFEVSIIQKAFQEGYEVVNLGRSSGVWKRAVESAFKNGIKPGSDPLSKDKEIKIRFIDEKEHQPETRLKLAASYEISVYLKPRYLKDGDQGEYIFRFIIQIQSCTEKQIEKMMASKDQDRKVEDSDKDYVFISTVQDSRAKKYIYEMNRASLEASQNIYYAVKRFGLKNMYFFRGGAPGLGKKR